MGHMLANAAIYCSSELLFKKNVVPFLAYVSQISKNCVLYMKDDVIMPGSQRKGNGSCLHPE